MSKRILRSARTDDDVEMTDISNNDRRRIPESTMKQHRRNDNTTSGPAAHQEAEEEENNKNKAIEDSLGKERTTRYKYRIQVTMTIPTVGSDNDRYVNVPYHQKEFCVELFKADRSINIIQWEEEEQQINTKSNPITAIDQLPTKKEEIDKWIAGITAMTDRNSNKTLQFFLYVNSSVNYSNLRRSMKPWIEANKHRMYISRLSTTNNRALAWIKDTHPDWTRLEDLRIKLQELVVIQSEEYDKCELDLRPRKIRIGKGQQAKFIWAIGITCGLINVKGYMKALWTGLSRKDILPECIKNLKILPLNPIPGVINNKELTELANDHVRLMDQLRKKSIIGFADITTSQDIVENAEPAENRATYTLQEYLLAQEARDKTKLFQAVESRGKNGYLVIYREQVHDEVEEFFFTLRSKMIKTFKTPFIDTYFNSIKNYFDEIEINEDQSVISTFRVAESYIQSVKSVNTTGNNSSNSISSTTPRKRTHPISLNFDDLSPLGSKSATNVWKTPQSKHKSTTSQTSTTDDETVATLKSEVQGWFDDLQKESKIEWKDSMKQIKELNEKITKANESNARLEQTLQTIQEQHKIVIEQHNQAAEEKKVQQQQQEVQQRKQQQEQKEMFKALIQDNLKNLVNQTVSQQIELHRERSKSSSPMRKKLHRSRGTTQDEQAEDRMESDSEEYSPRNKQRNRVPQQPKGTSN